MAKIYAIVPRMFRYCKVVGCLFVCLFEIKFAQLRRFSLDMDFIEKDLILREYTRDQKDITVWCSNDYLGMSAHPAVKLAVHKVYR